MIPAIKPNTKYTGGDRLCPDVSGVLADCADVLGVLADCADVLGVSLLAIGVMLGSGLLALADCTGQFVAAEDEDD